MTILENSYKITGSEVPIFISQEEGVIMRVITADKIMLVSLVIPSSSLRGFEGDEKSTYLLNLEPVKKALRKVSAKGSNIIFNLSDEKSILIVENFRRGFKTKLEVPSKRTAEQLVNEPTKVNFSSHIRINTEILWKVISDAKLISEEVSFEVTNEGLRVEATAEGKKAFSSLLIPGRGLDEIDFTSKSTSKYSLEMLNVMMDFVRDHEVITLSLATDSPLRARAELPGGGYLSVWIAPRV